MSEQAEAISERDLKLLLRNRVKFRHVQVLEEGDHFTLEVDGQMVQSARRERRSWKSLDTAIRFLRTIGVTEFNVRLKPDGNG